MNDENNAQFDVNFGYTLIDLKNHFVQSSITNVFNNQDVFNAKLDLMHILDSTYTPLYLFDKL